MKYGSGKLTKLQYGKLLAACWLIDLHQRDAVTLDCSIRKCAVCAARRL
jgi:hypothetical protein